MNSTFRIVYLEPIDSFDPQVGTGVGAGSAVTGRGVPRVVVPGMPISDPSWLPVPVPVLAPLPRPRLGPWILDLDLDLGSGLGPWTLDLDLGSGLGPWIPDPGFWNLRF